MKFADTEPGIESQLIDLSTISLARLRRMNSSALHEAMSYVLDRTGSVRDIRSVEGSQGERVD